jgi:hypothetical protein
MSILYGGIKLIKSNLISSTNVFSLLDDQWIEKLVSKKLINKTLKSKSKVCF